VNCSINENSVFSKKEVRDLFQPYKLVQLYTDEVPLKYYAPTVRDKVDLNRQQADGQTNLRFRDRAFRDEGLPVYLILEPLANGRVRIVKKYEEGKINDEAGFARFLKEPLDPTSGSLHADSGR
jgi:hypothetical protein